MYILYIYVYIIYICVYLCIYIYIYIYMRNIDKYICKNARNEKYRNISGSTEST